MVHDIEASWAAIEIAREFRTSPSNCFSIPPSSSSLSIFPSRQGRKTWPIADGVIRIEDNKNKAYDIALEFKRPNEGLHGILTAIGQSLAYVHKGFSAAIIAIPKSYETLPNPGEYVKNVLDHSGSNKPICVFTYDEPDTSIPSPFENRMRCERSISLDNVTPQPIANQSARAETQWAHLREGSSTPDAFFRYLQVSKRLGIESNSMPSMKMPKGLLLAVKKITNQNVFKYLSNSTGDSFHDMVWRTFWFTCVFTPEVAPLWKNQMRGTYEVNNSPTLLKLSDGRGKMEFFSGRSDSIKSKLVKKLNNGSITEKESWEEYAKNVHNRAHSYREDIDSGLFHLGLLNEDGRPTDLGYRFVDACERSGDPNTGTPKSILGFAILRNGQLEAYLHYVYRLSEKKFKSNPLEFTNNSHRKLDQDLYLKWLENELANGLKVIKKVSVRGGQARKPFQAELAILRKFNFVKEFRVGVGLEINWPEVQEALEFHT
ncbi:MAG: hypothetical protein ACREAD_03560 [Nitrosopumilaceae archaeon]